MGIKELDELQANPIDAFGSQGASVTHLISTEQEWSMVRIELRPDGLLGWHQAAADQLFIVIKGSGLARAEGAEPQQIGEGSIIFWHQGQMHETRAGKQGLAAIVVEADSLGSSLKSREE